MSIQPLHNRFFQTFVNVVKNEKEIYANNKSVMNFLVL